MQKVPNDFQYKLIPKIFAYKGCGYKGFSLIRGYKRLNFKAQIIIF